MTSKVKGFKVKDNHFQYGFNMPIPDSYIRNSNHIMESSISTNDPEKLLPKCTKSLERAQYERAFAYAASKKVNQLICNTSLGCLKYYGFYGMSTITENYRVSLEI